MERGPIRWRKGELIGAGAYGRVYMGMNLDSGELIAVKQVLIASNSVAKERAQAHITELEEEVKLLQNLSHTNIVRYLGTAREEEALNIFLEFVPGGSIASLLGKFGSFPEAVIRMYTRQLLLGLEYLHKNHIMHRDIKGANILVDNEGQIKVADFGASKKVVELATITGAKSMKGTPYWMAPEVIRQTGHNWRADIWSVGCTVIEMATGKPPWSQQFQEVAALFHIGTTKSHPPIPEHLSEDAKTFLLQCLQREPNLRPTASQLLQHPFVLEEGVVDSQDNCKDLLGNTFNQLALRLSHAAALSNKDNKIKHDDLNRSMRLDSPSSNNSFNPMSEPDAPYIECSKEQSPKADEFRGEPMDASRCQNKEDYADCPSYVDDDEVTESKIRAFLEEKASELKKLQTPLYEEYYGFWNKTVKTGEGQAESKSSPVKSGLRTQFGMTISSPNKCSFQIGKPADGGANSDFESSPNKGNMCRRNYNTLFEISLPRTNEFRARLQDVSSPGFRERQKQWEDELWQELQAQREERRRAGHLSGKKSRKGTWTISATSQPDPI